MVPTSHSQLGINLIDMAADRPDLLALDFDGVLCDGLAEYFQSSWRAYCQIWQPASPVPPPSLEASFGRLRPVIETGWEMPLLLRSLILGTAEAEILSDWQRIARNLVASEGKEAKTLGKTLDTVRDNWINRDLEGWLALHRFYPGVAAKVQQVLAAGSPEVTIITTKEGRFARRLLEQAGIELPPEAIIGKEIKQPKHETLRQTLERRGAIGIWFVEDRLKTLKSIQKQPDLGDIRLFLADWGYNTEAERAAARQDTGIELLSRDRFSGAFLS